MGPERGGLKKPFAKKVQTSGRKQGGIIKGATHELYAKKRFLVRGGPKSGGHYRDRKKKAMGGDAKSVL